MELTKLELKQHREAKDCHTCCKQLNGDKVHDHDHLNGKYRGPAHALCNTEYSYKHFKLPVILHNLRGYDSHLIL